MNKRKLFNSKWEKIVISLLATLVVLLIAVFAFNKIAEQKAIDDIMGKVNIDSGDVGYQENLNDISTEDPIKKLSEKEFILDKEAKTISVDKSLVGGSFCISSSPDGPTENDSWKYVDNGTISLNENEQAIMQNQEEQKVYVYYMAGTVSTMTTFNTSADTYTISTASELDAFANKVNSGTDFSGKKVVLMNDITVSSSFVPIGNWIGNFNDYYFKGTFDGRFHTISGLNMTKNPNTNAGNDLGYIGLFGLINDATVKNIKVSGGTLGMQGKDEDGDPIGASEVGAIVGLATYSTISNCINIDISIVAASSSGGIVGYASGGTISNCVNNGSITCFEYAGGIVGSLQQTVLTDCTNNGLITGNGVFGECEAIGGIVGNVDGSYIRNCVNAGEMKTSGSSKIGGIAGVVLAWDDNEIYNCKNIGVINGYSTVGGIAGGIYWEVGENYTENTITIKYCTNEASVTLNEMFNLGGIVGWTDEGGIVYISNCKNTGAINQKGDGTSIGGDCGGIVGDFGRGTIEYCINTGNITNSYTRGTGGIVGRHEGTDSEIYINNCVNSGNVTESKKNEDSNHSYGAGGIIGCVNNGTGKKSTTTLYINDCGNSGAIKTNTSNNYNAGGIIGINYAEDVTCWISNCYDIGTSTAYKKPSGTAVNYRGTASIDGDYVSELDNCFNTNNGPADESVWYDNIYGMGTGSWIQAWQISPTLIRHPYNVIDVVGTTKTIDTVWHTPADYTTYQWYVAASETGEGTKVSGATTTALDVTVERSNKWYYCIATGIDETGQTVTVTSDRALVSPTDVIEISIDDVEILPIAKQTYTGNEIKPTLTVKDLNKGLTLGTDYTVSYSNNINVGTATVTIKGIGDYAGTRTVNFDIIKAAGSVVLSATSGSITYPGTTTFTVTTNKSGGALSVASSNTNVATASISGTTVTVTAGTTAGTATITVTSAATTNYNSASATYKVTVSNGTLSVSASNYSGTYDGNAHGISVSCSTSGATITYATSESGTYSTTNPTYTNAGTYTTYYKVSKEGYTTVTGSKTVTISKATNTVSVSITGETSVGKTLTANATTVSDGTKSYQWWYSSTAGATSGTAISGATSSTYTVTSSMVGYYIGVTVSVAEGTNYKAGSGTAITTSKVAGTNYKDSVGNYYATLKEAFANANSGSTITVLKNVTENEQATVESGKSFVLDLNGKTITFNDTTYDSYICNNGNLEVKDTDNGGKIESTFSQESSEGRIILLNENGNLTITSGTYNLAGDNGWIQVIKNTSGTLNVNGGILIARGTNSESTAGIVANGGNVNITGGIIKAYDETENLYVYGIISSGYASANIKITGGDIYGDVKGVELTNHFGNSGVLTSTLEVSGNPTIEGGKYGIEIDGSTGDVQVKSGTIKGGTYGIYRESTGKLRIGDNSDKVSITSPVIQGGQYAVSAATAFSFYDGILKGQTAAYEITATDVTKPYIPTGYGICNDTEIIDGATYQTAYLAPYLMKAQVEFIDAAPISEYILGAERAGLTEYTSNLVSSIKFHNTIDIPTGAVNWDVSDAENKSIMAWLVSDNNGGYVLHIGAEGKILARVCDFLFYNYTNCTTISDLQILDTSSAINMRYMFANCQSLENLNLSSFKTSNVEEMNFMFRSCSKLTTLDLSGFDTSKVTNMDSMFKECSALKNLEISNFNTEQVTEMEGMFHKTGLTELSLNHFNTSKVINMEYMFSYCESLTSLKIDNFDTTNVTNMKYMFSNCKELTELDLSHFKTQKVTEMDYMFFNCSNLTNVNISSFNTSNVINMRAMFANCKKLGSIDVSHFNTSKVENMISMFSGCSSLTSLDVSSFDTSKVKSFSKMFMDCRLLTNLDLSNFSLTGLDGTTGNDKEYEGVKAINVNQMFYNLKNLQSILLGKDFSRIDGTDMFKNCTSLTAIITTRTSPMTLSTDINVESVTKLYVPTAEAETAYESATNYLTVFGADRVQPILELVGDNPANVKFNGTYEEKGITVAGMNKNADNTYTPYGYTVSGPVIKKDGSTVSSVDTTSVGTYTITYTIYDKSNTKGMDAVRIVEILKGNYRIESVYFETLQEAYESVTGSSATIIVEQSNEDDTTFTNTKDITLDLNGKTIAKISRALYNEGTLTITDSSKSNGKIDATLDVLLMNKGTVNVNGGTIEVKGAESSEATCWYVIYSQESGNVNLNDGTLKIARSAGNTSGGARVIFLTNGTTTINGGSIIAEGTGAMGIHSYNDASGKIIVNGGSIKATNYAINCSTGTNTNTTTVLMTNGYIEGGYAGIGHNSTGEVKVTGGTIVSDKYGILNSQDSEIIIGDDTAPVSTTTPVIIGAESGIHLVYGTIYFTDGILKGQTSGHRGTLIAVSGYGLQYGTEVIDGATYQTEILALANWSDGKSVYSTLEEAFEKVKDGSTLKALKDITDNSTNAVVNKLITIDLSGKNVSIPNSSIKIENGGTLEIIGKSGSTITSGQNTAIINNGGKLTIGNINEDYSNFPKVEGSKQAVSGNFTINGGTLIGTNNPPYTGTPTVDRDYFEIITSKNGTKYETTIQLEQVPPEITITPSTKEPTNGDVILTVEVTDNFSGVKKATYELDGEFYDLTLNASGVGKITVSENGTYTIHAEDNAGNKSSKTYEVSNIDRTPDNITSASVQDAEENKVKYATIIIENIKTDSVLPSKVVEILISNSSTGVNEGTWIPFETDTKAPWVLDTTDGNGEKTIYIWAKDNAGNISENPFVLKVILDTKLIGGNKNKIDLSFAGIDKNFDRSDLRNYQISYKTGDASANATQTELSKIDEKFTYGDKVGEKFSLTTRNIKGAGKLYVVVATKTLYDKAGNVNDVAEIETDYVIDTNAPTITYDASAGNVKIADAEGNLKAITVDGKAITISNNGTYNITSGYIKAYDLAGNVAELSL